MQKVTPFLMFEGNAKQAIDFYISVFKQSQIVNISFYGANAGGAEGAVQHATFAINGLEVMCTDSSVKHGFTFTPAMSLFVKCTADVEIEDVFERLSAGGKVLMPLAPYPFSKKFAWVADQFGVSWQLSLI